MLFNSLGFIFVFMPIVLVGFFIIGRFHRVAAAAWLAAASLFFYGYWTPKYLPLLVLSVIVNFFAGRAISAARNGGARKSLLWLAIAFNLGLLGYYKYANFFVANLDAFTGVDLVITTIVLPIGISFFTFTQIAFLVDTYRGLASEPRFVHYILFVSYFPHLVAGPILHHGEMMPQFADAKTYRLQSSNIAVGASIFIIGLAKKILIADNVSPLANAVFAQGAHPTLIESWIGVLAYTFQIYFDFSGYSDMAIGLSRMFGIVLPLNFNSPYKSANIIEFWRRWHMTLSRFLRDYLYIPLGGNRLGPRRRYVNLMATMLLGGLWHGAAWTFVIWGGLHGIYLAINHGWRHWTPKAMPAAISLPLTFLAVMLAWVFFRAPDLHNALEVCSGLVGMNGLSLPERLASHAGLFALLPIKVEFAGLEHIQITAASMTALAGAMFIAWLLPNTQEIFRNFNPCLEKITGKQQGPLWRPTPVWSYGLAVLFVVCVLNLNRFSEFIYFQF